MSVQAGEGPHHELQLAHNHEEGVPFQRFVLVLTGSVTISRPDATTITLGPNHYAFFPSTSAYKLSAAVGGAGVLAYERLVEDFDVPQQQILYGEVEEMPLLDTGVDCAHLLSDNRTQPQLRPNCQLKIILVLAHFNSTIMHTVS